MTMNLQHHFLIAMPSLEDVRFERSVIYICEHNDNGAMGLMVNKPISGLTVGMLLNKLVPANPADFHDMLHNSDPVFNGGPLADDRGFVIHSPVSGLNSSIQVAKGLMVTTSKDILSTLGTTEQPDNVMITLGYSGWQAGQLEQEVSDNSWLTVEADNEIIFNTPVHLRWQEAAKKLGINIHTLSSQTGHA